HVLQLAEQLGIYLMFCIDSFNSLRITPPYAWWTDNPYNAANGGMLAKPEEFFTNAEARRIFRNRLRYMVARWGYSPNLLSWEYWNEVDIIEKYISPDVKAWHQEMSRYLRGMDPWKHLQTTSYARSEGDPAVDGLPEMDYVQTHRYGPRDMGAEIGAWTLRKRTAFNKPHYVGEFGLDAGGDGGDRDPEGVSLHNGLWADMMNGGAGTAMLWYWDNYIHPRNLYGHYAALTAFTKGINWPRAQFRPAKGMDIDFVRRPSAPDLLDLVLQGQEATWSPSPANQPNSFTLTRTGTIAGLDRLAKLLHGVTNHRDLHNPATFLVDYPAAGRFLVNVRGVSGFGGAGLKLTLDGQTVLEKDFPDTDAAGTDTLNKYNGVYPVDVPAGKHTIVVENTGRDWLYVDYLLPAYRESMLPRLRAQGLAGSRMSIAWVQNTGHTWSLLADGVQPKPQQGAELRLPVARAGRYRVELWDTYTGKQLQALTLKAAGGRLTIPLPTIEKDLALKAILLP
ncbi:MAG TPA: hypothetical protein VHR86_05015, partial [Armatimonadota bacterium]|nr:hypothetical protein [Armatimonadota bacterium]